MRMTRVAKIWKQDGWVRPFVEQYRRALGVAVALGAAAAVFTVALMFTSGYLISAAAEMPDSIFQLMVPLAFVQIFGIGRPFLSYFARLADHDWVLRATSSLRKRLFESLAQESHIGAAAMRTGEKLGLLAQDVEHVQDLFVRCALPAIAVWVTCAISVIAFGVFSPLFALVMLVVLAVTSLLVPLASALVDAGRRMRAAAASKDALADVTDDVLGLGDWVCAGRREGFVSRIEKAAEPAEGLRQPSQKFPRRRDIAVQGIFLVAGIAVVAWAASRFGGQAGGAADLIAAFVIAFFPLAELIAPLGDSASNAGVHLKAVERLGELSPSAPSARDNSVAPKPHEPLDLVLTDVRFGYDREDVVRGANLVIPFGQKVAVLGPSGSGKSTLLDLMRGGLAPASGTVELGGVRTHLLAGCGESKFGVIQQDPYVFDGTLLGNVRVGAANASTEQVLDVLERVGLGELVRSLPEGLLSRVGENGARLSGGQRHRLALARVLVQDAPVVLLDEPFCAIDPITERRVLNTVIETLADKTVVLVTHHLTGVAHMDRVLFFEDGRIVLDGTPAELEQTSKRYRRLLAFDRGL